MSAVHVNKIMPEPICRERKEGVEADGMNDPYLPSGVALHTGDQAGQTAPDSHSLFKTLVEAGRFVSSHPPSHFGGEVIFIISILQKKKLRLGVRVTSLRSHTCPRMSPSP